MSLCLCSCMHDCLFTLHVLHQCCSVSWCGMWRLTQRKQLIAPGPCPVQAGPGGERLGASRTATNRALSAPGITAISSGPAATHTQAHGHTQMHAWYAHMLKDVVKCCHSCAELLLIIPNCGCIYQWSKGWLEVVVGSVCTKRRPNSNSC